MLIDDGERCEPEKLLAHMDEHMEQMAAHLQVSVPVTPMRWVRGSLVGQHGRAFWNCGICNETDLPTELTTLDRHEMAHVLITMTSDKEQNPPAVLAEGWAESQSRDRADLILALVDKYNQGEQYTLQELIGPDWYNRSAGPAYHHGGPLVIYLMEHYGPEKFLSLYHGVRPATFLADCERILGDSWEVVEERFWKWLDQEATAALAALAEHQGIVEKQQAAKNVELAESVDPAQWNAILDGYRAAWSKRPAMPEVCAFAFERVVTSDDPSAASEALSQYVIDGKRIWRIDTYGSSNFTHCLLCNAEAAVSYSVTANGRITRSDDRRPPESVLASIHRDWDEYTGLADLGHHLPIAPERRYLIASRITSIRPPSTPDESLWEIEFVSRRLETTKETTYKMQLDAAADWCIANEREESADNCSERRSTLKTILGRAAAIETAFHNEGENKKWTVCLRLRELKAEEAEQVRQQVESLARRSLTRSWSSILFQPIVFAIAWPSVGVLLFVVGIFELTRKNASQVR